LAAAIAANAEAEKIAELQAALEKEAAEAEEARLKHEKEEKERIEAEAEK
jgi:hypothetical protein